jgi:hypothetical protein
MEAKETKAPKAPKAEPKDEGPKEVPLEDFDQNLPASYDGLARPAGMTADEAALADAEGAAKAEAKAK